MIENDVEKYLVGRIAKIGGLVWKLTSPGISGVPDRIVIYHGKLYFVEMKRPGSKMRKLQEYRRKELGGQGFGVICLDSKKRVDIFIDEMKRGDGK